MDENADSYQQDDDGEACALRSVVSSREPEGANGAGLNDAGEVVDAADGEAEQNAHGGVPCKVQSPAEP